MMETSDFGTLHDLEKMVIHPHNIDFVNIPPLLLRRLMRLRMMEQMLGDQKKYTGGGKSVGERGGE